MEQETKMDSSTCCGNHGKKCGKMHGGGMGCVYGLGFVGAAIYYIQLAPTFWAGVVGFLKALVWPAFLVYNALTYFGV
ncbi:MAG: hypothetical protein PHD04_00165 [Candidatus Pacebacteria bacterium]|nr:hypothetical protein [Candidatus Paceibacterota bacterium]